VTCGRGGRLAWVGKLEPLLRGGALLEEEELGRAAAAFISALAVILSNNCWMSIPPVGSSGAMGFVAIVEMWDGSSELWAAADSEFVGRVGEGMAGAGWISGPL